MPHTELSSSFVQGISEGRRADDHLVQGGNASHGSGQDDDQAARDIATTADTNLESYPDGSAGSKEKDGAVNNITDKEASKPASETVDINNNTPITYRYLTFDTPLPLPNNNSTASSSSPSTSSPSSSPSSSSHPPPAEISLSPYQNPTQWSIHRKTYHLILCCIATMLTAYCAGAYSPPTALMEQAFHASRTAVMLGITTFCLGFALAPMVLAPFSEINGRYPIFAVSGVVFVVFQIVCGFVPDLAGMLVARFFVGVGGSVFSTMIGGVIADLWDKEGRNTPMAIYSGSVLVGTGLGPLVSAVMTYRFGDEGEKWKWVFWHQVIMGGVLMILMVGLFKESRGSVVLSRKAGALNQWYAEREKAGYFGVYLQPDEHHHHVHNTDGGGATMTSSDEEGTGASTTGLEDEEKRAAFASPPQAGVGTVTRTQHCLVRLRWRVKADEERATLGKAISISVWRPFHLLFTEPVVFFFSLWVSFAWAVLYLTFASVPYVFKKVYGWNIEQAGYVFAAMMIGSILSTVIGVWQDELLKHPQWRVENWEESPSCTPSPQKSSTSCAEEVVGGVYQSNQQHRQQQQQHQHQQQKSSSITTPTTTATTRTRIFAILRRHFPVEAPESRLYFTCITATLLPIGLFLFGFTSHHNVHWIAPAIAICLATMGIYSVYLATFNYLADVYHMYASSALAAQSCCRNILGGIFPLVTLPLFRNLGNAGAGGLLGGVALVLTFVPWVLVFFGPRIRARSAFAVGLEKAG